MYTYYPQNPSWNNAAVVLSMLSEQQINDVVNLINARGRLVVSDLKSKKSSRGISLSPLAILDESIVPNEDMEEVALGLSTVLLAQLRTPKFDREVYANILKTAFSLPTEMADAISRKIETADILGGSYKDPKGEEYPWYKSFYGNIKSTVRKTLNSIPAFFGVPWEIEARQDFDIDLLYELKLMGREVAELNSRSRLMAGQAAFNMATGMFAMGDIEEGDPDMADMALGDAMRQLNLRSVPAAVFGNAEGLRKLSGANQQAAAQNFADNIGLTKSGESVPAKSPAMKRALDKALSASPGKAVALGLALGAAPTLIKILKDFRKKGDVFGDINADEAIPALAAQYGDDAAAAWLAGDVEGFFHEVGALANEDFSTGDPDLDSAIEAAVLEEGLGDIEALGPEVGGVFTRARINMAKRRASRRTRRSNRKMGRVRRKNELSSRLQAQKDRAALAGTDESPYFKNQGGDEGGSFDEEGGGEGESDFGDEG
jgi:hypothetical protein